jgi:hypothetical protein
MSPRRSVDFPTLYHFTCHHGHDALGDKGDVVPLEIHSPANVHLVPDEYRDMTRISWFTDLEIAFPEALGLTTRTIRCDRTLFRYRVVDTFGIVPWTLSVWRNGRLRELEKADGALPVHWYVAAVPVRVVYDPVGVPRG